MPHSSGMLHIVTVRRIRTFKYVWCVSCYRHNKDQQDALFFFSLFQQSVLYMFQKLLYMQIMVFTMHLHW